MGEECDSPLRLTPPSFPNFSVRPTAAAVAAAGGGGSEVEAAGGSAFAKYNIKV